MKKSTWTTALVASLFLLPNGMGAQVPQLEGIVASSSDNSPTGLYSIPTEQTTDWTLLFEVDTRTTAVYSGVRQGDMFYVNRVNAQYGTLVYLDAYDLTTNTKLWTNYLYSSEYLPYDLTFNEADGKIYGLFLDNTGKKIRLATVEYINDGTTVTEIAPLEGNWNGLTSDSEGNLYAIRMEMEPGSTEFNPIVAGSTLFKIDRHDGTLTEIGSTGQRPLLSGSASIDPKSNRLFWTVAPNGTESYLCEVDLQTGEATKLFDFPGNRQVIALHVPVAAAEDSAPAAVTDAVVSFPNGLLEGYVSFTSPSTLFDGTPATGELSYTITQDGYTVASGQTSYGVAETIPVNVAERGLYKYMITVSNSAGPSPKVETSGFAGFGTPESPATVNAFKSNGKVYISWEPVTSTIDGGFIEPANVTYNVVRQPDNLTIATGIYDTSLEVEIDDNSEMTAYKFQVTAVNGGQESAPSLSGNVVAGSPALPWIETFDSEESLHFFNIIDANGDDRTWGFYNDCVRIAWNSSLAMDDWLISPGIALTAGRSYKISLKAKSENPHYAETVEAKWGHIPTIEALSNVLIEPVTLTEEGYRELTGYISAPESQTYYIGIHGISQADAYYLMVDDLSIEEGVNNNAPDLCTDLTASPAPDGEWIADMTLKAPEQTIGGNELTELTKIVVIQNSEILHTFDSPSPGELLTCQVNLIAGGDVLLQAIAYNNAGAGLPAEISFFAGIPKVIKPGQVAISEPSDGIIKLEWSPVTETETGETVDPSKVSYNIYDLSDDEPILIESGVRNTDFTLTAIPSGEPQKFVCYGVAALTDGGETEKSITESIPAGKAYEDYRESFAGGEASTLTRFERINYGNWDFINSSSEIPAQDDDNGLAVMNGYFAGYNGALYTGKVSLGNLRNPVFQFYSYTPDNEKADKNIIAISVNDGSGFQEVYRSNVSEIGNSKGWHLVEVPLARFAGKTLSFRIYAETFERPYTGTYIDNMSVVDVDGEDLELVSLSAPKYVRSGDTFKLMANVRNNSASDVDGYQLEILADGEVVHTVDCEVLAAMESFRTEIELLLSPRYTEPIEFVAKVNYGSDPRPENDSSAPVNVIPVVSTLPAPSDLTATHQESEVTLKWNAPVISDTPADPVSEDFENAEAWSHEMEGWLFIDADNAAVAGFGETQIPGITPGETHSSFFTFSATGIFEGNNPLAPHSGKQYLAALARFDSGLTDDWAISPELSGEAQTISFWAQSYDATDTYMEAIEVLYSDGSIYTEEFLPTGFSKNPLPNGWTRYEVSLPQGARRFAIHSSSRDSFMLMVDDVTYQPASTYNAQILGYNLYRDNSRVNDNLITSPEFIDNVSDPAEHLWAVTTVYLQGESRLSNAVTSSEFNSVGAVGESNVRVKAQTGQILISGAEGHEVTIANPDGKLIYSCIGQDRMTIEVPTGLYLITIGNQTFKLIVR